MNTTNKWEQRWHPLREEWVIIAAHRQDRPWHGETIDRSEAPHDAAPEYVRDCYFCPGNARVSGARNDNYPGIYVFDNDHPCVGSSAPERLEPPTGIFRNSPATGIARVVCYSPKHNVTLAELDATEIESLIEVWRAQYAELGSRPEIKHVLIFENKGELVGVSNPHPHCQIYATNFTWKTFDTELAAQRSYRAETGRGLFGEIIVAEQRDGRRILYEDEHTIAFVPYFARYAYEVYVAPKRRVAHLFALREEELFSLGKAIKDTTARFDNLFGIPFPYVMPIH